VSHCLKDKALGQSWLNLKKAKRCSSPSGSPDAHEEGRGQSLDINTPLALPARASRSPSRNRPTQGRAAASLPAFYPQCPTAHLLGLSPQLSLAQSSPLLGQTIPASLFPFKYSRLSLIPAKYSPFPLLLRELGCAPAAYIYTYPSTYRDHFYCIHMDISYTHCPPSARLGVKILHEIHYFLLAAIKSVP